MKRVFDPTRTDDDFQLAQRLAKATANQPRRKSFEKTARELGYLWVTFLLAKSPSELVQRWQFKLDRQLTLTDRSAEWLDDAHRDLAYRLIKKIAKQVIPQWFHLLK